MGRVCLVCNLSEEDRREVDRQLVQGKSITTLAQRYNLSRDVLYRHKKGHIGVGVAGGVAKSLKNHGVNLMQELDTLMTDTRNILQDARDKNHNNLALKAIQQFRGNLTLVAAIQAEIHKQQMLLDGSETEFEEYKAGKEMSSRMLASMTTTLSPLELHVFRGLNMKLVAEHASMKVPGLDYDYILPDTKHIEEVEEIKEPVRGSTNDVEDPVEAPSDAYTVDSTDHTLKVRPIPPSYTFDPRTGSKSSGTMRRAKGK